MRNDVVFLESLHQAWLTGSGIVVQAMKYFIQMVVLVVSIHYELYLYHYQSEPSHTSS